jgi:GNAT superfamily N-acetyltransferase
VSEAQVDLLYRQIGQLKAARNYTGYGGPGLAIRVLAFLDGDPAGFALFHPRLSTWLGRPGCIPEDLFVTQVARGKGVRRRLMTRLAAIAVERGWERIDFQVVDWNPARGF